MSKVLTVTGQELPSPEVSAAELATWQAEGGLFNSQVPRHLIQDVAVSAISGCWFSERCRNFQGYVLVGDKDPELGGNVLHRVLTNRIVGVVTKDLDGDHLCRFTSCCYPRHQESVDFSENQRRRLAAVSLEQNLLMGNGFGLLEAVWLADLVDGTVDGIILTKHGPFKFNPETKMPELIEDPLISGLPPLGSPKKPYRKSKTFWIGAGQFPVLEKTDREVDRLLDNPVVAKNGILERVFF